MRLVTLGVMSNQLSPIPWTTRLRRAGESKEMAHGSLGDCGLQWSGGSTCRSPRATNTPGQEVGESPIHTRVARALGGARGYYLPAEACQL